MKKILLFTAIFISLSAIAQNEKLSSGEKNIRQKMKADGLSEQMIDKLLQQRKELEKTGRHVNFSSLKKNPTVDTASSCNMSVENGWDAWEWRTGTNSGANPPIYSGLPVPNPASATSGYHITSGTGIDFNTPGPNAGDPAIPIVCPGFGNHSIMIGDSCKVGSVCQQLVYPLTVTIQDTSLFFSYAAVIEDAGHLPSEQPFVSFCIFDSIGNQITNACFTDTGSANMAGYYPVSGTGCAFAGADHYKPWTIKSVNLSAYIGQTVSVVITNADCIYGGHFAYSYWDFGCSNSSTYLAVSASSTNAICADGRATATTFGGTAPYTYLWSNGQTTQTATGLAAGTYTINVSDANNLTATNTVIVNSTAPNLPNPAICMVTVDSLSKNNIIMWDKNSFPPTDSFFIYREISTNNYQPIGSVPYNALSEFIDTVRTKYFPNSGDPNAGTYRYKIGLGDTCNNKSAFSPYHNTIFIINNSGAFYWQQLYTIESAANPVNSYVLIRDDFSNGNWHAVNSVSGTQQTVIDPAYSTYQSTASWRVETMWNITCTPSIKNPSVNSFISSLSNIYSANGAGVNENYLSQFVNISPNPSSGNFTIDFGTKNFGRAEISIFNILGEKIIQENSFAKGKINMDASSLSNGIYFLKLQTESGIATKKIVISR